MLTARLFCILLFTAFTAVAEDSPISVLDRSLTPIIRQYFPTAEIQTTDKWYIAKCGAMKFTVHGHLMTGEIVSKTSVQEGPNYRGFLLRVRLEEGQYHGQLAVPQDYPEPYWHTFIDARQASGGNQHFSLSLSYGTKLSEDFKKAVINALPKERSGQ